MNFATLGRFFFRGALAIVPLCLSIYACWWVFNAFEKVFNRLILKPFGFFDPPMGVGFLSGILVMLVAGALLSNTFISKVYSFIQTPIKNIPLFKSIYSAIEDLLQYFNPTAAEKGKVVQVQLSNPNITLIGLLTQEQFDHLPELEMDARVSVFIPMSYALGGYTIFVSKDSVKPLEMRVEAAMKLALTAWMKKV